MTRIFTPLQKFPIKESTTRQYSAPTSSLLASLYSIAHGQDQTKTTTVPVSLLDSEPSSPEITLSYTSDVVQVFKGSSLWRQYSYKSSEQHVLFAAYGSFPVPLDSKQTLPPDGAAPLGSNFGPFQPSSLPPWTDDCLSLPTQPTEPRPQPEPRNMHALAVFLSDGTGLLYPNEGGSFAFSTPNKTHQVTALALSAGRGLLVQIHSQPAASLPFSFMEGEEQPCSLFSLSDYHSGMRQVKYLGERTLGTDDKIFFTSTQESGDPMEPKVVASYNETTGKLAIWSYGYEDETFKLDETDPADSELLEKYKEFQKIAATPRRSQYSGTRPEENGLSVTSKRKRPSLVPGDVSSRQISTPSYVLSAPANPDDLLEALDETVATSNIRKNQNVSGVNNDRRASLTRNELSITMDRMVIGGVMNGEIERDPGDFDVEQLEEANSLDFEPGPGSLVLECIGESTVGSNDPTAGMFEGVSGVLFDARKGCNSGPARSFATLAVRIPRFSKLIGFTLVVGDFSRIPLKSKNKIPQTLYKFRAAPTLWGESLAMAPILYSRPNTLDLLSLSPAGHWEIVTSHYENRRHHGVKYPLGLIPGLEESQIKTIWGNGTSSLLIRTMDNQFHMTHCVQRQDDIEQQVLQVMSFVMKRDMFLSFWTATYLSNWKAALDTVFGLPKPEPPKSAYDAFLTSMNENENQVSLFGMVSESLNISQPESSTGYVTNRMALESVVFGLHLLVEELKLGELNVSSWQPIGHVIANLCAHIGQNSWKDHYERTTGQKSSYRTNPSNLTSLPSEPPKVLTLLKESIHMAEKTAIDSDFFLSEFDISKAAQRFQIQPALFYGTGSPLPLTSLVRHTYSKIASYFPSPVLRSHAVVLALDELGMCAEDVDKLAWAVRTPILEAFKIAQAEPGDWSPKLYNLVNRKDLVYMSLVREGKAVPKSQKSRMDLTRPCISQLCHPVSTINDTLSHPEDQLSAGRFTDDKRLDEVIKMLQFEKPVTLPSNDRTLDQLTPQVQQSILTALSTRTLALPVGYGILHFMEHVSHDSTDSISIPKITTSARILPMPAAVALNENFIRDGLNHSVRMQWPEFHTGVAAVLRIKQGDVDFDSSLITFNKPTDLDAAHGGFLLGLGLTGRINSLVYNQAYEYLKAKHDPTSVGLLLGLSVAYIGTGDKTINSLLSVHLSAFHPAGSSSLNVSLVTQAAGLLSIGLLHLGTGKKSLADTMLKELKSMTIQTIEDPSASREAYALSAGFAFGLIRLGEGMSHVSKADEGDLLQIIKNLLSSEELRIFPGQTNGEVIDTAVTSAAATVGLGLMYMKSGRCDIADLMEIPESQCRLDYVRSDLLLLRVLIRSLILWDKIEASRAWIEAGIPAFIRRDIEEDKLMAKSGELDIAFWNMVAGACFAISLKYAGTASAEAHTVLVFYFDKLVKANGPIRDSNIQSKIRQSALRTCFNVIAGSLGILMAGSGELNALRRLRVAHGSMYDWTTYGGHMAVNMALGLLLVGGGNYSVSTSNVGIAALVLAFYPVYPTNSADNKTHLQAARHLWTLAIEKRCVQVKDVDTEEPVFLPIRVRMVGKDGNKPGTTSVKSLVAPTLIPELHLVDSIQTESPRYWPFSIDLKDSLSLEAFIKTTTIHVKRRTGHLTYAADPKGVKSIFTRSKSETGSCVIDFGETGKRLSRSAGNLREFLEAFNADDEAIAAVSMLCYEGQDRSGQSASGFEAYVSSLLLECLTRDKRAASTVYFSLYWTFSLLSRSSSTLRPALHALEQLNFLGDFYRTGAWKALLSKRTRQVNTRGHVMHKDPMIQQSLISYALRKVEALRSRLLLENQTIFNSYMNTMELPSNSQDLLTLAIILCVFNAPSVMVIAGLKELVQTMAKTRADPVEIQMILINTSKRMDALGWKAGGGCWKSSWGEAATDIWLDSF